MKIKGPRDWVEEERQYLNPAIMMLWFRTLACFPWDGSPEMGQCSVVCAGDEERREVERLVLAKEQD